MVECVSPARHVPLSYPQALHYLVPDSAFVVCLLTEYCIQGHSMRLALSGTDAKPFYVDHPEIKTMWIHTGPGRESAINIYVLNN